MSEKDLNFLLGLLTTTKNILSRLCSPKLQRLVLTSNVSLVKIT